MNDRKHFTLVKHYFIIEGEARLIDECCNSDDELFKERIEFKEKLINDISVRLADADLKISLILTAQEKYQEEQNKYLLGALSLEYTILTDVLHTSLLEVAEILAEFLDRLKTKIPARGHLFKKSKKILATMDKDDQEIYTKARLFLFPELDDIKSNGKVNSAYFHEIADRLREKAKPILIFRDKVLAHKYDKERFVTRLLFKQYCEIREVFKNILNAVSIVGAFICDDRSKRHSAIEIERTANWLIKGLLASAKGVREELLDK